MFESYHRQLANLDEALLGEEGHGGHVDAGDSCNDYCVTRFLTEGIHLLNQIATNTSLMMRRGDAYSNLNSTINPVRAEQDE